MTASPPSIEQPAEQLAFARLLGWGVHAGTVVLLLGFAAYVSGWLAPRVPVQRLPEWWSLPLAEYLSRSGSPTGWRWLAQIGYGDTAALLGVAFLAGIAVPCLLALLPLALARGDRTLAALCIAEAAVIVLAASGWLAVGH
jgi:hypothetical protein